MSAARIVIDSRQDQHRCNPALCEIQEQKRPTTISEQNLLSGYIGWGAVALVLARKHAEL